MVYSGKPSRGCQTCKSRRIKCDETRPACKKCRSTGRTCPGYVEEVDLLFRNQTQSVTRKAQKSTAKRSSSVTVTLTQEDLDSDLDGSETSVEVVSDNRLQILRSILPTNESIAVPFFFRNYILNRAANYLGTGVMSCMMPFWNNSTASSPIRLALVASALTTCGKFPGRMAMQLDGADKYLEALRAAAAALSDPVQSTADETLMAVMILAFYENMTSSSDKKFGFANHIEGATALVRHRGERQFQNPQSLAVYRAVREQTVMSALQLARPLDDFPLEADYDEAYLASEFPSHRLTRLSIGIPGLRHRAKRLFAGTQPPITVEEVEKMQQDASAIDLSLAMWHDSLNEEWSVEVIAIYNGTPDDYSTAEVWPGPVYSYTNLQIANTHNNYRIYRLYLQSIIRDCVAWLKPNEPNLLQNVFYGAACTQIQELINGVCASVPYHFGFRPQQGHDNNNIPYLLKDLAADGQGAFLITWPLFVCATMNPASENQRAWLRGRLALVARDFHLDHARILSKRAGLILEKKASPFPFDDGGYKQAVTRVV